MKHIQESIIGRRGAHSPSKLWLLYPVGDDYVTAINTFPRDYEIHFNYINKRDHYMETLILFCINRQQLKKFFNHSHSKFANSESALFEVNPRYLKNFEDVQKWLGQIPSEDFDSIHTANELNKIFNIPKYIKSL